MDTSSVLSVPVRVPRVKRRAFFQPWLLISLPETASDMFGAAVCCLLRTEFFTL